MIVHFREMASLLKRVSGQSSKKQSKSKKKKSALNCFCAGLPATDDIEDSDKPVDKTVDETVTKNKKRETNNEGINMGKAESKQILQGTFLKGEKGKEPKLKKVVAETLLESGGQKESKESEAEVNDNEDSSVPDGTQGEKANTSEENIGTDVDVVAMGTESKQQNERKRKEKLRRGSNVSSASSDSFASCNEAKESSNTDTEVDKENAPGASNPETVVDGALTEPIAPKENGDTGKSSDNSDTDSGATETTKAIVSPKRKNPLKKMQSKLLDAINYPNFDSFTPEVCIELMKSANLKFISNLNKKLRQNDKEWNEQFLDNNGAQALLDLVETLGVRRVTQLADAMLLLECVQCIKTIMNSRMGLAYLVDHGADLNRLVRGKFVISLIPYIPFVLLIVFYLTCTKKI